MARIPPEFKRFGDSTSIIFPCAHCGQMVLVESESIGGMAICAGCHQAQDVPPVPCRYTEECTGVYVRCGGHLVSHPGEAESALYCDECEAEYAHEAAPEKCTRIVCNQCRRPIQ